MPPFEFLTRSEVELLSEEDLEEYLARVREAADDANSSADDRITATGHYFNVLEWTLPPDEFDLQVRRPIWDRLWEDAESQLARLNELVVSEDISEADRALLLARIEQARAVVEHKQSLNELEDISPS
jgi:hypothetical protein